MKSNRFWTGVSRFLAVMAITLIVALVLAPGAWAGTKYKTLHKFTGGADGTSPWDTLIFDQAGNLYGTTGGAEESPGPTPGNVFELTPNSDGTWTESVLYTFTGGSDGGSPVAGLIFDQAGNLYGTTEFGGNLNCQYGCGVVFELTPDSDGSWTESVLYSFTGGTDGSQPFAGLTFDQQGNLYGTTGGGGNSKCQGLFSGCGVAFELAPNSDGTWTESVLHAFNGKDGQMPLAGVIFDQAGNLYGTTRGGGQLLSDCGDWMASGCGVVYELTPGSGGSWTEKALHAFNRQDGMWPIAPPVFDAAGNLYGTTEKGASNDCGAESCGTVFELTPGSNGKWKRKVLDYFNGKDGYAPGLGALIFDTAGSLYGITGQGGAYGDGNVYKLTPMSGGKRWKETVLHVYKRPGFPLGGLIFDGAGNLYGTTQGNGTKTFGSVFEITP
jgi:uncharacterized repeat protein (TIGR03803 family)